MVPEKKEQTGPLLAIEAFKNKNKTREGERIEGGNGRRRCRLLSVELLVDEEDEKVDVDEANVEHLHCLLALVLELEEVL